ncbi:LOW QUALITY PROTEIN: hypothetical protein U9M48_027511, partial [Paspalum notatum var. saurae]
ASAKFDVVVRTTIGEGKSTKFWTDRWLDGKCIADLAPSLFSAVPKRAVKSRTVPQALHNRTWVADIRKLTQSGIYSSKSAYSVFFLRSWMEEDLERLGSLEVQATICHSLNIAPLTPSAANPHFFSWRAHSIKLAPKEVRKGLNTLFILVAWELWKFKNSCVFEICQPSVRRLIEEEGMLWCRAGAAKLLELYRRSQAPAR